MEVILVLRHAMSGFARPLKVNLGWHLAEVISNDQPAPRSTNKRVVFNLLAEACKACTLINGERGGGSKGLNLSRVRGPFGTEISS